MLQSRIYPTITKRDQDVILFFGCGMFPLVCAVSKVRHGG